MLPIRYMRVIKFPHYKQFTWTSVCLGRERWLVHVGKCKRLPVRRPWSTRSSATPCQGQLPQRRWWRFGTSSCHLCCNWSLSCHVLGLHATNREITHLGFLLCKASHVSTLLDPSSFQRWSCSLPVQFRWACWWKLESPAELSLTTARYNKSLPHADKTRGKALWLACVQLRQL